MNRCCCIQVSDQTWTNKMSDREEDVLIGWGGLKECFIWNLKHTPADCSPEGVFRGTWTWGFGMGYTDISEKLNQKEIKYKLHHFLFSDIYTFVKGRTGVLLSVPEHIIRQTSSSKPPLSISWGRPWCVTESSGNKSDFVLKLQRRSVQVSRSVKVWPKQTPDWSPVRGCGDIIRVSETPGEKA